MVSYWRHIDFARPKPFRRQFNGMTLGGLPEPVVPPVAPGEGGVLQDTDADIRVLAVSGPDTRHVLARALQETHLPCTTHWVETETAFVRELEAFGPDLVLACSGFAMCPVDRVLAFTRRARPEVPIITFSEALTTEAVFALLSLGARNCVTMADTGRLGPVITLVLGRNQDLQHRERKGERLRFSELRYRRVFEAAKDGILILDARGGKILDANPYMTTLLGYSHDEYVGKYLWEIGSFADLVANQLAFRRLQRNRYIRYDDLPLKTVSGATVEVEFVSNVYSEDGHDTIQCNIRDISARKASEVVLLNAQKMAAVGILTGGVAHNVNNLLGVIIGNLELLGRDPLPGESSAEYVDEALQAALGGAELIHNMLTFARAHPMRVQRVDVAPFVTKIGKTLRSLLAEDIDVVVLPTSATAWPVSTDRAQLEAAVLNLAVNAREAMPRGGRLTLSVCNHRLEPGLPLGDPAAEAGDFVMLSVSDTGVGIPPVVMPHIFEPFFSTKGLAEKPGTGLGLSTVYGFVKQTGGHITVRSNASEGTMFSLYLPRMHDVARPSAAKAVFGVPSSGETVLVVEDNAAVRRVVVRHIERMGYIVLQSEDAPSALEILAAQHVDLLFTDIVMSGAMDGLSLARTSIARWPGLKVLLTTGFGDFNQRSGVRGLRVLEKPYRTADLTRALSEALSGPIDPGQPPGTSVP